MGRQAKTLDPATHWERGDEAITIRLTERHTEKTLTNDQVVEVDDAFITAGFASNRTRPKKLVLGALTNALDYLATPYKPYVFKKLTRDTFGTERPHGPHQMLRVRLLLCAALFQAWRLDHQSEPRINRKIVQKDKRTTRTPFVIFAAQILAIARIGKVEDSLMLYRSYERATHAGTPYDDWVRVQTIFKLPKASKKVPRRAIYRVSKP